jgi:hypothetical protein
MAIQGNLGSQTCCIYVLDPTGTTPLEIVADLVPGVGPLRVTVDTIDAEQYQQTWQVTQNTLQDLTETTSHVQKDLIRLTVSGIFGAAGPMGVGIGTQPSSGLVRFARFDLLRYSNLTAIANARRPVMVVTPRCSLAQAFIVGIPTNWTPTDGDSLPITLSFIEARVMTSASVAAFADVDSMATGNNKASGGGTGGSGSAAGESFGPAGQGVPPLAPF